MPANYTNQSMLRQAQGGSVTNRLQNQRSQAYTRNTAPTTAYNTSGGQDNMYSNMFSNYGWMNPFSTSPAGAQYGSQQSNLGRYRPPMMNGGQWADQGGYAYNVPNAFGSTGMNYMGGFGDFMQQLFNPFMGYGGQGAGNGMSMDQGRQNLGQQPQSGGGQMANIMDMFGGGGRGQGVPDFSGLQSRMPTQQGMRGPAPNRGGGFGPMPLNQSPMRKPMQITPGQQDISNIPMTSTPYQVGSSFGAGLPWGFGG